METARGLKSQTVKRARNWVDKQNHLNKKKRKSVYKKKLIDTPYINEHFPSEKGHSGIVVYDEVLQYHKSLLSNKLKLLKK